MLITSRSTIALCARHPKYRSTGTVPERFPKKRRRTEASVPILGNPGAVGRHSNTSNSMGSDAGDVSASPCALRSRQQLDNDPGSIARCGSHDQCSFEWIRSEIRAPAEMRGIVLGEIGSRGEQLLRTGFICAQKQRRRREPGRCQIRSRKRSSFSATWTPWSRDLTCPILLPFSETSDLLRGGLTCTKTRSCR